MKNTITSKPHKSVSAVGYKDMADYFKNRQTALQWLRQRGQVSQSKFYDDCNAGLVTVHSDKTLSKFEVALYAEKLFAATRQAAGSGTLAMQRESDEARKIRAEAEIKEMQAEDARRKANKHWLHKDDAYGQMAALLGLLRDSIKHQFYIGATVLISSCGGDNSRAPELYEFCEELIGRAFNEVANMERISVLFVKQETD